MSHSISVRTLWVAVLPLFVLVTACDSGGSNGGGIDNSFTLTIEPVSSGGSAVESVQTELNGFSFFFDGKSPNSGRQVFGIYMGDEESFSKQSITDGLFGWVARAGDRPDAGSYNFTTTDSGISASQFVGFLAEDFTNPNAAPLYLIESGTLTIDTSSDDKVSGSIDATGTRIAPQGGQQTVSITGTFTAENVEDFVAFSSPGV